jgi:ATP-dependent Clp protease ATP-binding subunit ClpA
MLSGDGLDLGAWAVKFRTGIQDLLAQARAAASARCQIVCTAEQLLEAVLQAEGHAAAANLVGKVLDSRPKLVAEPVHVPESSALVSWLQRLEATPSGLGESAAILRALLSAGSPVPADLQDLVRHSLPPPPSRRRAEPGPLLEPVRPRDSTRSSAMTAYLRPLAVESEDPAVVDRPELVDAVLRALGQGNPLLVGPVGCGRSTLLKLVARRLLAGRSPHALRGRPLYRLDPVALTAAARYRVQLEDRLDEVVAHLRREPRPPIVFVDDLDALVDIGSSLVPSLRAGAFLLLGRGTPNELGKWTESAPNFIHALHVLRLTGVEAPEAIRLLAKLPALGVAGDGVGFAPEAQAMAVALCREHLPQAVLPGAAAQILAEAAENLAFELEMLALEPQRRRGRYWSLVEPDDRDGPPSRWVGRRHLVVALAKLHAVPLDRFAAEA